MVFWNNNAIKWSFFLTSIVFACLTEFSKCISIKKRVCILNHSYVLFMFNIPIIVTFYLRNFWLWEQNPLLHIFQCRSIMHLSQDSVSEIFERKMRFIQKMFYGINRICAFSDKHWRMPSWRSEKMPFMTP